MGLEARKIIFFLFYGVFMAYLLISSVRDLTDTSNVYNIRITSMEPFFTVKYRLHTEYYYLGVDADTYESYIIKDKKKFEDNFTPNGDAKNPDGYEVTGVARKLSETEIERELESHPYLLKKEYAIGKEHYLQVNYVKRAVANLIAFAMFVLATIVGYILFGARIANKGLVSVFLGLLLCAGCALGYAGML